MKQLYTIILILFGSSLLAQSSEQETYMGFPDKLLNSPQAASLYKYGDIPVGLSTGTPNITIPLYKINLKDFEMPISLNYSSNGVKVDEISSSVGLGWSLFSGGVITRNLNDNADETTYRSILPDNGYGSQEMLDFLNQINTNPDNSDTEPDIFYFNFNGFTGKFYLDENLNPCLIEPINVKVERLSGFGGDASIDYYSFKITTDNGTEYWFGGGAAVETSFLRTFGDGAHQIPSDPTQNAWYLSKITFPDKNDSVTFNYFSKVVNYNSSITQNVKAKKATCNDVNGGLPTYYAAFHSFPVLVHLTSLISRITDIHWTNGDMHFYYTDNDVSFMRLDSVKVQNSNQKLIKSYLLDYIKVSCDMNYKCPDDIPFDSTTDYRLFLVSLRNNTSDATNPIPYFFEYYYPNELPPRFSYSQDYWGYFNGKNNPDLVPNDLSLFDENWYNSTGLGYEEVNSMFQNVGGNKDADGNYAIRGLLKKITYPTAGSDSLIYEANTVNKIEHQLPQQPAHIDLVITTSENDFGLRDTSYITEEIPFTQRFVPFYVHIDTALCWDSNDPSQWISMSVSVKDLTTNTDECLYVYNAVSGQYNSYSTPLQVKRNSNTDYLITYNEGHVYKFTLSVSRPCLFGVLQTSYYDEYGQDISINKEVGGLRVKKIISNDKNGLESIRCFYYGYIDSLNVSSGKLMPIKPAISFFSHSNVYFDNENRLIWSESIIMNLSSSSLFSISNFQGNNICYSSVIEGFGNNFENGAIEHKYNTIMDALPICYYDPIIGTPNSNLSFENGNEIERNVFKYNNNIFVPVSKIINYYKQDSSINKSLTGFTTSTYEVDEGQSKATNSPTDFLLYLPNLCKYTVNTQWHYLYKSEKYQYDNNGLEPLLVTINYYHDNPKHLQVSREYKTDSKGNLEQTFFYYPEDYDSNLFLVLKQKNITGIPIDKRIFNKLKLTSGQLTRYNTYGQPTEILISETENGTDLPFFSNTPYSYGVSKKLFDYETTSHALVSYKSKDNFPTSIYWIYNNAYPIIKAENATYNELSTWVALTQPDMDAFMESLGDLTSEQARNDWASFNSTLRGLLPDAQIKTYTYIPLVGLSSETDVNGKTTYYQYDDLNRLVTIRDNDYNVVKHINYHYSSNN